MSARKLRNQSYKKALRKQKLLEQSIQSAQEIEKSLHLIQESLEFIDKQLTAYIADKVDAAQMPQEAQKIQSDLTSHEISLEEMKKRNQEKDAAQRVLSQIDVAQKKLQNVSMKFRLFQKPANFEQRLEESKMILDEVKMHLPALETKSVEQEVVQSQLSHCVNLYKSLSEVKSEVEMVIKTGRQIVQKKQTENPKELDERVTALKLHYNELGAKVTERKQQLEKCLKLSRKMRKEMNVLTEWLAATDMELTKRSAVDGMPSNLDAEIAWGKATQKEIEKQKAHLKSVTELGEALKTVLGKKEMLVEDKLSLLNSNWIAVTSRAQEWLNLLLEYQKHMETFDKNVKQITKWIIHTDELLDESEKKKPQQQEDIFKRLKAEMNDICPKVDSTRDQAANLMANRGDHCRKIVEPQISELNCRFAVICHRIKTGKASIPLTELEQFNSDIQKLLEPLEAEIQQGVNLKEEDFNKDMSEDNECTVNELLQRGDHLQQRITDVRKREEIKIKQQLLQTKHNALKDLRSQRRKKALEISHQWYQYKRQADDLLKCLDDIEKKLASLPEPRDERKIKHTLREETMVVMTEDMPLDVSYVPSTYLTEISHISQALSEVEQLLNAPELCAKDFEDLFKQEESLKSVSSLLSFNMQIINNILMFIHFYVARHIGQKSSDTELTKILRIIRHDYIDIASFMLDWSLISKFHNLCANLNFSTSNSQDLVWSHEKKQLRIYIPYYYGSKHLPLSPGYLDSLGLSALFVEDYIFFSLHNYHFLLKNQVSIGLLEFSLRVQNKVLKISEGTKILGKKESTHTDCPLHVLGIEFRSSERAVSALIYRFISLKETYTIKLELLSQNRLQIETESNMGHHSSMYFPVSTAFIMSHKLEYVWAFFYIVFMNKKVLNNEKSMTQKYIIFHIFNINIWADEMVQWVKMLAVKPDNMNLITGTYKVKKFLKEYKNSTYIGCCTHVPFEDNIHKLKWALFNSSAAFVKKQKCVHNIPTNLGQLFLWLSPTFELHFNFYFFSPLGVLKLIFFEFMNLDLEQLYERMALPPASRLRKYRSGGSVPQSPFVHHCLSYQFGCPLAPPSSFQLSVGFCSLVLSSLSASGFQLSPGLSSVEQHSPFSTSSIICCHCLVLSTGSLPYRSFLHFLRHQIQYTLILRFKSTTLEILSLLKSLYSNKYLPNGTLFKVFFFITAIKSKFNISDTIITCYCPTRASQISVWWPNNYYLKMQFSYSLLFLKSLLTSRGLWFHFWCPLLVHIDMHFKYSGYQNTENMISYLITINLFQNDLFTPPLLLKTSILMQPYLLFLCYHALLSLICQYLMCQICPFTSEFIFVNHMHEGDCRGQKAASNPPELKLNCQERMLQRQHTANKLCFCLDFRENTLDKNPSLKVSGNYGSKLNSLTVSCPDPKKEFSFSSPWPSPKIQSSIILYDFILLPQSDSLYVPLLLYPENNSFSSSRNSEKSPLSVKKNTDTHN
ncbi:Dmd [Phodopus roborovskii]|uniref:Dmd protein n=1 Tax=Phodopus roborovskii TaxID=109678 RepID=A0AAU9Z198_PHORO|nr:Dmd [Phodopus roborovskii]